MAHGGFYGGFYGGIWRTLKSWAKRWGDGEADAEELHYRNVGSLVGVEPLPENAPLPPGAGTGLTTDESQAEDEATNATIATVSYTSEVPGKMFATPYQSTFLTPQTELSK